jgi:hypothetical protein
MKRIFLALALLPLLALPASAEEQQSSHVEYRKFLYLYRGLDTPCKEETEGAFVYIEENNDFAICDGKDWRKLNIGEVVAPVRDNAKEGGKE